MPHSNSSISHKNIANILLKHYPKAINKAINDGMTPFLFAAQENHLSIAQNLLKDPEINPEDGMTGLLIAAQ